VFDSRKGQEFFSFHCRVQVSNEVHPISYSVGAGVSPHDGDDQTVKFTSHFLHSRGQECEELFLLVPIYLHDVVLN
jgi:hypothetical protein